MLVSQCRKARNGDLRKNIGIPKKAVGSQERRKGKRRSIPRRRPSNGGEMPKRSTALASSGEIAGTARN